MCQNARPHSWGMSDNALKLIWYAQPGGHGTTLDNLGGVEPGDTLCFQLPPSGWSTALWHGHSDVQPLGIQTVAGFPLNHFTPWLPVMGCVLRDQKFGPQAMPCVVCVREW